MDLTEDEWDKELDTNLKSVFLCAKEAWDHLAARGGGSILSTASTELNGRLIVSRILREDFSATGALPSDTEDLINLTLQVKGTEAAVIFVEQPAGGFKISFRSRCSLDCSKLAEQFAGGGHKAAAGATVAGTYDDVRPRVLDAVKAAMP